MNANQALFQVAIALIPGFFFGGALIERRTTARPKGLRGMLVGLGVATFVVAGVVAEIIAVKGAIDPSVGEWARRFVVLVVVLGTIVVGVFAASQWAGSLLRSRGRKGWAVVVAAALVGTVIAQLAITTSLERATARAQLDEAGERHDQTNQKRNDAEAADNEARATLLTVTSSAPQRIRTRLTRGAVGFLDRLDEGTPKSDLSRATPERRSAMVSAAIDRINDATQGFRNFVNHGTAEEKAGIELAILAAERLSSAEVARLITIENDEAAKDSARSACEAAKALGCAEAPD